MNNKILNIDLDSEKVSEKPIEEVIFNDFLGGRGLGIKLLTDYLPKGIDPLSKENPLIFSVGPLT